MTEPREPLALDAVTAEVFEAVVGTTFVRTDDPQPFTLVGVRRLPASTGAPRAEPFALDLTRTGGSVGQETLPLHHDTLGDLVLFVVPVGEADGVVRYEAVFS